MQVGGGGISTFVKLCIITQSKSKTQITSISLFYNCLFFRRKDKKIICQFCRIRRDCDQNGDRMAKSDKKLPCFTLDDYRVFLVSYEKYGTLSVCEWSLSRVAPDLRHLSLVPLPRKSKFDNFARTEAQEVMSSLEMHPHHL